MSRRALLGRSADLEPQDCAHCGKRVYFGVVYSVRINNQKFRVCGLKCHDDLKKSREGKSQ